MYIDLDRAVVGMAVPLRSPIALAADETLRATSFMERRQLGILNNGGSGVIHVGSENYPLDNLDCLYKGRGAREIAFESTVTFRWGQSLVPSDFPPFLQLHC